MGLWCTQAKYTHSAEKSIENPYHPVIYRIDGYSKGPKSFPLTNNSQRERDFGTYPSIPIFTLSIYGQFQLYRWSCLWACLNLWIGCWSIWLSLRWFGQFRWSCILIISYTQYKYCCLTCLCGNMISWTWLVLLLLSSSLFLFFISIFLLKKPHC